MKALIFLSIIFGLVSSSFASETCESDLVGRRIGRDKVQNMLPWILSAYGRFGQSQKCLYKVYPSGMLSSSLKYLEPAHLSSTDNILLELEISKNDLGLLKKKGYETLKESKMIIYSADDLNKPIEEVNGIKVSTFGSGAYPSFTVKDLDRNGTDDLIVPNYKRNSSSFRVIYTSSDSSGGLAEESVDYFAAAGGVSFGSMSGGNFFFVKTIQDISYGFFKEKGRNNNRVHVVRFDVGSKSSIELPRYHYTGRIENGNGWWDFSPDEVEGVMSSSEMARQEMTKVFHKNKSFSLDVVQVIKVEPPASWANIQLTDLVMTSIENMDGSNFKVIWNAKGQKDPFKGGMRKEIVLEFK